METILTMVQRVTAFILIATLLTNLFQGTEYKKYFSFAVGLIVIALVLSSILSVFQKENIMNTVLIRLTMDQEQREKREEIRMFGEEYEERIRREVEQ